MNKEEAIQILSTRDAHGVLCGYTSGVTEALDIAIESLQKDIERHEMVIRASERHLGIVRCKDCKYCWYDDYTESLECRHNKGLNEEIYGNDFCCYGERREE